MSAYKKKSLLLVGLLFTVCGSSALGQEYDYVDNSSHELQFFAPVDMDFENLPIGRDSGYFFRYDKLSWATTGEWVEIGDPDLQVQSEDIFPATPVSEGTPIPTYTINNSIQEAPPNAEFAWGERYEFGYQHKNTAWTIGILDGPEAVSIETYGFQQLEIPNTIPLSESAFDFLFELGFDFATGDINGALPGTGSNDLTTSRNGFGSVHVNFDTPAGFLTGLRDYALGDFGQTIFGPGTVVTGLVISSGDDGEQIITEVAVTSGGDGGLVIDDLDGDALGGFFVILDPNGNVIGQGIDFDDFHTFNIRFDEFFVRNITKTDGIELMQSWDLNNRHRMVKHQNSLVSIGCGVRYLRLEDAFYWEGRGDMLGRTYADTSVRNSIVGPQIQATYSRQKAKWNFMVDGRFTFGYNIQDIDQIGAIGESLVPGGANSPANAQPHAVSYGMRKNDFAPLGELRAEMSYRVTRSVAFRLGYTATIIDNITRASQTVRWYLPDLGIRDDGQQEIFINGANFGFDVVY